jgi:hypothetical protein
MAAKKIDVMCLPQPGIRGFSRAWLEPPDLRLLDLVVLDGVGNKPVLDKSDSVPIPGLRDDLAHIARPRRAVAALDRDDWRDLLSCAICAQLTLHTGIVDLNPSPRRLSLSPVGPVAHNANRISSTVTTFDNHRLNSGQVTLNALALTKRRDQQQHTHHD